MSAGEAAVYVPANDEKAFAAAIDSLLRDPDRRATMGAIGRDRVERQLSWEIARQELLNFYDRLLSDID